MGNTCKTCINNDDGLCDRKGILVEDEDFCEHHWAAGKKIRMKRHEKKIDITPELILYVSNTVNSHCSISVISLISEKIRKKQLAGEIQQPYQKIVTYETEKFSDLSIKEAYEYLKTLPEFEGAEDVFEDKNSSV